MITPIIKVEQTKQYFNLLISKISLPYYQNFFKIPGIDKRHIKNWNDLAFLNFLGIENILNMIEHNDEKVEFDPKNF